MTTLSTLRSWYVSFLRLFKKNVYGRLRQAEFAILLTVSLTVYLAISQHMIADTVRLIRHCQSDQPGEMHPHPVTFLSSKTYHNI